MNDTQAPLFFEQGTQCDRCGEISPNHYIHTLNHYPQGDLCGVQDFALRHIRIEHPGTGQPSLAQQVTRARNLNIPEHLVRQAIHNRRPPKPLTTIPGGDA